MNELMGQQDLGELCSGIASLDGMAALEQMQTVNVGLAHVFIKRDGLSALDELTQTDCIRDAEYFVQTRLPMVRVDEQYLPSHPRQHKRKISNYRRFSISFRSE